MQARVVREKSAEQALQALMRLCAKSEHSSGDAMRLMARWRVDPGRRAEVLGRLVEMRFIDDRRFAEAYTRDKIRFQAWGRRKIRNGLVLKGVPREIIDEVLAEAESDEGQLMKLLAAKRRSVRAASVYELKMKLVRFAVGRGFDYEQAAECVETLLRNEDKNDEE